MYFFDDTSEYICLWNDPMLCCDREKKSYGRRWKKGVGMITNGFVVI